jgi:hypothetical protein
VRAPEKLDVTDMKEIANPWGVNPDQPIVR